MDVFGSDGEKVGSVVDVVTSMVGGSGLDTASEGGAQAGATPNSYLKVEHRGFLGTDVRTLYIPATQVAAIEPGEGVRLQCAADNCLEQFGQEPPGLS
jgi:hypothetical protein